MKLFELYRYAKPSPGPDVEHINGVRNLFNATRWPAWPGLEGAGRVQLDHGINPVVRVAAPDGIRRPAVLIASKPHQGGSDWTPWHDELDPFVGHIRYYGDSKPGRDARPTWAPGNAIVLSEFVQHRSNDRDARMRAAPLLFFEGLVHEGHAKGFWRFIGVGVLERAERVTQVDRHGVLFVNYAFDCALVDLSPEDLRLSWDWIAARRDRVQESRGVPRACARELASLGRRRNRDPRTGSTDDCALSRSSSHRSATRGWLTSCRRSARRRQPLQDRR